VIRIGVRTFTLKMLSQVSSLTVKGSAKRHESCIVHKDVDAAAQFDRRLDHSLRSVIVRHIGGYRDDPPSDRAHLLSRCLDPFLIPAHQNEIPPPGGQVLRQC
jgi:hypothetical protein